MLLRSDFCQDEGYADPYAPEESPPPKRKRKRKQNVEEVPGGRPLRERFGGDESQSDNDDAPVTVKRPPQDITLEQRSSVREKLCKALITTPSPLNTQPTEV